MPRRNTVPSDKKPELGILRSVRAASSVIAARAYSAGRLGSTFARLRFVVEPLSVRCGRIISLKGCGPLLAGQSAARWKYA
jgi:hypothetical protein